MWGFWEGSFCGCRGLGIQGLGIVGSGLRGLSCNIHSTITRNKIIVSHTYKIYSLVGRVSGFGFKL